MPRLNPARTGADRLSCAACGFGLAPPAASVDSFAECGFCGYRVQLPIGHNRSRPAITADSEPSAVLSGLLPQLPASPTVVHANCSSTGILNQVARQLPTARCVAFVDPDPDGIDQNLFALGVDCRHRTFQFPQDCAQLRPDLLIFTGGWRMLTADWLEAAVLTPFTVRRQTCFLLDVPAGGLPGHCGDDSVSEVFTPQAFSRLLSRVKAELLLVHHNPRTRRLQAAVELRPLAAASVPIVPPAPRKPVAPVAASRLRGPHFLRSRPARKAG